MPLKLWALTGLTLATLAMPALAQEAPPPPKPDAPMADEGPGKRPPPPPPPGEYASFDVQLGRGAGIHVACGKDDLKTCIEAASPLIDKAQGMRDLGPGGPPPPPKKP